MMTTGFVAYAFLFVTDLFTAFFFCMPLYLVSNFYYCYVSIGSFKDRDGETAQVIGYTIN